MCTHSNKYFSILLTYVVILLAAAVMAFAQDASREKRLNELAEAERAFAAYTVKEGFRDGFMKFFADDGIGFGPQPERTREKLIAAPPSTGPRKVIFNWAPMFGDISEAGDLGYTTGPVLYTDVGENPRPPRHGMYFSVWQKQSDGTWKVAVDMGVPVPNAVAPIDTIFTPAQAIGKRRRNSAPAGGYLELDSKLSDATAKPNPAAAYEEFLDKQFRVHRGGVMPITGSKDLTPVIGHSKFEVIGGKVASSDDMAFTYGKYTTANNSKDVEVGYYVHVWRRDKDSRWRLAADVQNALPKSDK